MRKSGTRSVILALLVTLLTSAVGWAFDSAAVAHDLDHDHDRRVVVSDPVDHLDMHQQSHPDGPPDLDAATHLYLHAVGHAHPCFLSIETPVFIVAGSESRAVFIPAFVPESIRDRLLRPPRSTLAS